MRALALTLLVVLSSCRSKQIGIGILTPAAPLNSRGSAGTCYTSADCPQGAICSANRTCYQGVLIVPPAQ